jgi:hypothetical protein
VSCASDVRAAVAAAAVPMMKLRLSTLFLLNAFAPPAFFAAGCNDGERVGSTGGSAKSCGIWRAAGDISRR